MHVGLNKGQAKNALAKAVFFNRLDEMRDRSFENQRYRASGLNLVVAAIIPWNTVYLERAIRCLKEHGLTSDDNLLQHRIDFRAAAGAMFCFVSRSSNYIVMTAEIKGSRASSNRRKYTSAFASHIIEAE